MDGEVPDDGNYTTLKCREWRIESRFSQHHPLPPPSVLCGLETNTFTEEKLETAPRSTSGVERVT